MDLESTCHEVPEELPALSGLAAHMVSHEVTAFLLFFFLHCSFSPTFYIQRVTSTTKRKQPWLGLQYKTKQQQQKTPLQHSFCI